MAKRRGPMTAAEHVALLKQEGRYEAMVEARRRRDEEIKARASEWRRAEEPLLKELRAAGLKVGSAWDLVNTSKPYPTALPILFKHLARPYPDRVREGIARALAVRGDAAFAWDTLLRLYLDEPAGTDAKDGLAVALAAATRSELNQLTALATDERHGGSRILLIRGISRVRSPEAREALDRLVEDPVVGGEVRHRLKRRKS